MDKKQSWIFQHQDDRVFFWNTLPLTGPCGLMEYFQILFDVKINVFFFFFLRCWNYFPLKIVRDSLKFFF